MNSVSEFLAEFAPILGPLFLYILRYLLVNVMTKQTPSVPVPKEVEEFVRESQFNGGLISHLHDYLTHVTRRIHELEATIATLQRDLEKYRSLYERCLEQSLEHHTLRYNEQPSE